MHSSQHLEATTSMPHPQSNDYLFLENGLVEIDFDDLLDFSLFGFGALVAFRLFVREGMSAFRDLSRDFADFSSLLSTSEGALDKDGKAVVGDIVGLVVVGAKEGKRVVGTVVASAVGSGVGSGVGLSVGVGVVGA